MLRRVKTKQKNEWVEIPERSVAEWLGLSLVASMILEAWSKDGKFPKSLRVIKFDEKTLKLTFETK